MGNGRDMYMNGSKILDTFNHITVTPHTLYIQFALPFYSLGRQELISVVPGTTSLLPTCYATDTFSTPRLLFPVTTLLCALLCSVGVCMRARAQTHVKVCICIH